MLAILHASLSISCYYRNDRVAHGMLNRPFTTSIKWARVVSQTAYLCPRPVHVIMFHIIMYHLPFSASVRIVKTFQSRETQHLWPKLLRVPAWHGFVNKHTRGTENKHTEPSHCTNEHIYRATQKSRSFSVQVCVKFTFCPNATNANVFFFPHYWNNLD